MKQESELRMRESAIVFKRSNDGWAILKAGVVCILDGRIRGLHDSGEHAGLREAVWQRSFGQRYAMPWFDDVPGPVTLERSVLTNQY